MVIDEKKCIEYLKINKLYFCCENPMWSFSDSQDGNIRAFCEYCENEVYIPLAAVS